MRRRRAFGAPWILCGIMGGGTGGGGGGGGGGLPTPIPSNAAQVVGNDGAGTAQWRQLTQDQIASAFTGSITLSTATLVQRGATLSSVTATCAYSPGAATSGSIATSYSGATDGGDIALGAWTLGSPFTSGSAAGTVKRNAAGGSDPVMTCTLTYANATSGTKTTTDSTTWTYKVFAGVTSAASPTEADIEGLSVFNALKQTRTFSGGSALSFNPSSQYIVIAFPDLPAWTTGTPTFIDQNGATFVMDPYTTVAITNSDGVTCNYRCYRSNLSLSVPFTITVS